MHTCKILLLRLRTHIHIYISVHPSINPSDIPKSDLQKQHIQPSLSHLSESEESVRGGFPFMNAQVLLDGLLDLLRAAHHARGRAAELTHRQAKPLQKI